ncbi:MAG: hypothetical protein K2X44_10620 [Magnetospirillum sp.]|nr:hypothetical protein [Magnetospirillum sp.]
MSATIEKLQGPATRLEGFIDALDGNRLFGWAWDRLRPQERLHIEISAHDTVIATIIAEQRRADLATSGIGDGGHAFEVDLTGLLPEGATPMAVAISPATGERTALNQREAGNETQALLRQVVGAMDLLGRGQRQLHATLRERSETTLAEIAAAQRELKKQQDCMEVFLVRFDGLLRQLTDRMEWAESPAPRRPNGWAERVLTSWFK